MSFGRSVSVILVENGSMIQRADHRTVPNSCPKFPELLSMGDTIEVLESKWLREEMKEMIGRMKKMYGGR